MMDEKERIIETPGADETYPIASDQVSAVSEPVSAAPEQVSAASEQVSAALTENRAEQEKARKPKAARTKKQILSIQKKKKRTKQDADQDGQKSPRGRHEVVERHDIRYRGPLSYRHMMILGWLCLILSQVSFILSTAGKFDPSMAEPFTGLIDFGNFVSRLFMPFLLLANFSKLLSSRQQFKGMLLRFGGLSVLMGLALPLVYEHYVKGIADTAGQLDAGLSEKILQLFQEKVFADGYLAYNMFIDLFLCTLFLFFLMYHFKRPVRRGWVICFRSLAVLPVAYELGCIVLKALCKNGNITLPMYASPFLTTKPPMTFAAFIALALFIKRRERIFMKHGRSYEEYGQFLETNANSLHFSVHACVTFIIAAVIDGLILFGMVTLLSTGDVMATGESADQVLQNAEMLEGILTRTVQVAVAAGFGESMVLFIFAPIVLLFSYNRTHKNTVVDMFIPVAAVGVIVALYFEAGFQAFLQLPGILSEYSQALLEKGLSAAGLSELDLEQLGLTEEELMELLSQAVPQP